MSENENEIPQSMLDRVARLIEQAEQFRRHNEEGSASAALARADAIMLKYAIDRSMAEAARKDPSERQTPISKKIPFVSEWSEFYEGLQLMICNIAKHCRVKVVTGPQLVEPIATLVGFPEDVEYCQMLWTSVYLQFVSKIDPKWDPELSAEENVKILKDAGRKWGRIAEDANAHGFPCTANDGRLKAAYRRQCRIEGVEPTAHTQRHVAYRASYAKAFSARIAARLREQRKAQEETVAATPGSAVALRDRFADVLQAFYELFPHLRPRTAEEREKAGREWREWWDGLSDKEKARYEKMRARQRQAQENMHDPAGSRNGDRAASVVDLGANKVEAESIRRIGS